MALIGTRASFTLIIICCIISFVKFCNYCGGFKNVSKKTARISFCCLQRWVLTASGLWTRYTWDMDVFEVPNVLAAGLVPLIVGFFWYHPRVFGAPWVRMMSITPEMAERGQGSRMRHTLISLVAGVAAA